MTVRIDVRQLAETHGLRPKKALGQSFLTDPNIIEKIAEAATRGDPDAVLGIGPGLGSLTAALADRTRHLVAVEKDRALLPVLQDLFHERPEVSFVVGDATELVIREHLPDATSINVAGNLPYSVTTPLLLRLLAERAQFRRATVMIQREVATRLGAEPGNKDYGSLTVLFAMYFDIDLLFDVSPGCFWPRPEVTSTVLALEPLAAPRFAVPSQEGLERVVRAAFSQRRKTMRNSMRSAFEAESLERAAKEAEIDLQRRAETLTGQEFARLASALLSASEP
jgi:16S rRNA (adenine1518-N6/adenine1519-N6)-dimethyltransferase